MTEERKTNPVQHDKVKVGDMMAFIYWTKVRLVDKGGSVQVMDLDTDTPFTVIGKELVERACSADQYAEEVKASMTAVARLLVESYNRPFTVTFTKASGDERVLRGRLIQPEPLLGRSMVEDLDGKEGDRIRLVDHRTIISLTVDGVKYVVGK